MAQADFGQDALNVGGQQQQQAIAGGQTDVKNAYNAGQNSVNSFSPMTTGSSLLGKDSPQTAGDYMNTYTSAIAKNPTYQDLYTQGQNMYGVQPLQKQAQYLQNQVNQVAPNQYSLARGFDVSEPQVENAINTNLRFLQPAANAAMSNYQNAAGLAQGYMNAGMQQNQQNLLPIQSYGQYLSQEQNNVFQGLVQKMNAGVSLSTAEMAQLSALQQAAASNAVALGQSGANYAATISGQQEALKQASLPYQFMTLNPNQTVYNAYTGSSYSPYSNFMNTLGGGR